MDINNIAIWGGMLSILIIILVRIFKLKRKFMDKIELITSSGYCIFAYVSAITVVKMTHLAILTYTDKITIELILLNKVYVFFAWFIIGIGAIVAYISLLVEEKKTKNKNNLSQ